MRYGKIYEDWVLKKYTNDGIPGDSRFRYFDTNYGSLLKGKGEIGIIGMSAPTAYYYLKKYGQKCFIITFNQKIAERYKNLSYVRAKDVLTYEGYIINKQFQRIFLFNELIALTLNEQVALLSACYNAIREKGEVILEVPNSACLFTGGFLRYEHLISISGFSPKSLTQLLKYAGFSDITLRRVKPVQLNVFTMLIWKLKDLLSDMMLKTSDPEYVINSGHLIAKGVKKQ